MRKLWYLNLLFLIAGFVFTACSGARQVTSQLNNGDIKIDGNPVEWKYLNNISGKNISFGFSNDANNLYIIMITNDKNKIASILHGGLEVWLDPGNSENKIGIRYPEKPDPGEMMEQMKKQGLQGRPDFDHTPPGDMSESKELDPMITNFLASQKLIYVINEDNRVLKSYPIESDLYQANLKVDKNTLCYELKVPFGTIPLLNYDINKDSKSKINVEIVSGKFKLQFDNMQRPDGMGGDDMRPSGPPPGGGPGGGGPGGGGPGGGGPGGPGMNAKDKQSIVPIDFSFEVILTK